METAIIAALSSLFGVTIGGIISYQLQKLKFEQELQIKREENKTENVAEDTIRYYLKDDGHLLRSFRHLSTKIGGFEENELRRLLVRSGAVRFIRKEDNEEMWCLVERLPEHYAREKEKREKNRKVKAKKLSK